MSKPSHKPPDEHQAAPGEQEAACSRREFMSRLGYAGVVAVGATAAGVGLHNRDTEFEAAALRLPDYRAPEVAGHPMIVAARGGSPQQMLPLILERMGGFGRFIQAGDVVVVKPNIGFATPPAIGATTNPEVVGAVVRLCLAQGAREVRVVDHPVHSPARCYSVSGIEAAVSAAGGKTMLPNPGAFRDVEGVDNVVLRRWPLFWTPLEDADKLINLPVAKHHSLSGVTLGMKNWFGLLGGARNLLHQDIDTAVADLASMIRPTLTILDATRVMFRNGPTGGSPNDVRHDGILAVSTDPVALDAYGASVVLPEVPRLPFLEMAEKREIGTTDLRATGFEMIVI